MNIQTKLYWITFAPILLLGLTLQAIRNAHRPQDPDQPVIVTYWEDDPTVKYEFRNSHLQEAMFKIYDEEYFKDHLLPEKIPFRYEPEKSVSREVINTLIENLLKEISQLKKRQKKINFSKFEKLKIKDVNRKNYTGLYVLRFKEYPFVLKLFMETPEGIINPNDKGFEPMCFYYLAGLSRHFNGFTRIKNVENIRNILKNDPVWVDKADCPHKYSWLPKNCRYIIIEGKNIGGQKKIIARIPATYGIICDYIIWERPFNLTNLEDKEQALALTNRLKHHIDSNIKNFGVEIKTGKIVPIDYENFIVAVGLEDNTFFNNYTEWYGHLTYNMLKRMLFQNKEERRFAQYRPYKGFNI